MIISTGTGKYIWKNPIPFMIKNFQQTGNIREVPQTNKRQI